MRRSTHHLGGTLMRRQKLVITIAALVIAAGAAVAVWMMVRPSYDDMVKDCQKSLTSSATKTHRPEACKGLKQDDYDTLLMAWTLKHALKEMPQDDQDMLDYYDDGSVNGSLTDGE
ncbi:hypothetical protein [Streptomyces sp. NPDC004658]|uniref:hypothetical protein n=1 Tax=Streptomyces sp. NPDC004658 TaxID=3154672 RepID=UPI0033AD1A05